MLLVRSAEGNRVSAGTYALFTSECARFNPGGDYFVNYCKGDGTADNAALAFATFQCVIGSTSDDAASAAFNIYGAPPVSDADSMQRCCMPRYLAFQPLQSQMTLCPIALVRLHI